jgi:hypothetical protein
MRLFPAFLLVFLFCAGLWVLPATAQITSAGSGSADPGTFSKTDASGVARPGVSQSGGAQSGVDRSGTLGSTISLLASSTMNVVSEMGGAFRSGSKCDGDGNLYIRKQAMDRPLLGPVVKIDPKGKRTALFDPAAFSQLGLDRADAFSPAPDGGIYQIATRMLATQDGLKQRIYVLHFASDGSASSPILLDADFEVYTFAAFAEGNFLVSGMRRDALNKNDHGRNFTAVFSADGRELAQLSFPKAVGSGAKAEGKSGAKEASNQSRSESRNDGETAAPTLDLAEAEVGRDGNLYVMRAASPTLIYLIAPTGQIMKTLKIAGPARAMANGFHVSGNRLALSFWDEANERQMMVIADAQTGRKIASYANSSELGQSFACYSADEGVFTFLRLGEDNALEVIRAEPE